MAKRKDVVAASTPRPKRTAPTEPAKEGGSYDGATGQRREAPPEHKPAERDESVTDGQGEE